MFEAFSGIGCQKMALERVTYNFEIVGVSEIDKYALKSYKAMHGYCNNFGSITDIKGSQLPQIDIFTYSFPCTDLSKAGQQKGLINTRSGLVYEVLRLLHELKNLDRLPTVLVMENVIDLVQVKFTRQFNKIQKELEELGYMNYTEVLNARDYGVAQNRERVFTVSILGKYNYSFPQPIPLKTRLKDYLEKEVEDKYFLSDKLYKCFTDMTDRNGLVRGDRFKPHDIDSKYAYTITTKVGSRATDNFIKINGNIRKLTPLECWRLMGIKYKYFDKVKNHLSETQLYKQAGNGIVIDVLEHIFKQMIED